MGFSSTAKRFSLILFCLLISVLATFAGAPAVGTNLVKESSGTLATIRGVVRDDGGSPIAEATVAIFRAGSSRLLKQVSSSSDGSFLAKIVPGTYTVLAVAEGFNPTYLFGIEVNRAADLNYGLKLERAGYGDTLPEKRVDRNSSKWRIRAAQNDRSIYQHQQGNTPVDEHTASKQSDITSDELDERLNNKKAQTVVQSYFAADDAGNYAGINFATLLPVRDDAAVVIAGQTGLGKRAPQRFEADVKLRPNAAHQLRLNSSAGWLGNIVSANRERPVGQVSLQALDEWNVREGIIFVFGIDYSRFVGAGDDASLSPRLGLQYDLDSKTRLKTAFTTQTEEKTWAQAMELEGESVAFAEPVAVEDLLTVNGKPQMNKSRRLEFGVERILDNTSTIEANAFVDTTLSRGVGLNRLSFDTLGGDGFANFVSDQQGSSQGLRLVYTKRLNGLVTASGGYSFGRGQKLSQSAITDPAHVFESDFFQSFFAQLAADLKTGTSVRTIYRLSPQATVFAIDPFKGSLAIYDPGLSVMVTQELPNFGLPLRAEAILDGRNLFDFQAGISGDDGCLKIAGQQRTIRGGIQVRF